MPTEKTGERVAIEVSEALAEAIAAGPCGEMTFICGVNGRPMVKEAFVATCSANGATRLASPRARMG